MTVPTHVPVPGPDIASTDDPAGFLASDDVPSPIQPEKWIPGNEGPLRVAVLFVDLVSSSEFASVMGLREYARYVDSFRQIALRQIQHTFEVTFKGRYRPGTHYSVETAGDEIGVFLHSGKPANDVYQLMSLAVALKCAWLGAGPNTTRLESGQGTAELAAGLHQGLVWARRESSGFAKTGHAINVAKRAESASREGNRFRILATDPAFKAVNRRLRNFLFCPRRMENMKGVVVPVGVHEVAESFLDVSKRLAPGLMLDFENAARAALATNSFDLWIHSCLQVAWEARGKAVTDEALDMARHVLEIDPANPAALHHAAQGLRERGDPHTARLYLEDLTRHWPAFADGWLELGRLQKALGEPEEAARSIRQARRHGVTDDEEPIS